MAQFFVIQKSETLMIRYENGTKDIFNETQLQTQLTDTLAHFFLKGQTDAVSYYTGYKGAGTGTLIVSLLSPLVGLFPAIACSVSPPLRENLGYPSEVLFNNPDYRNGYTQKAKKIKSEKVWTNWGVAFGVNLVAFYVLFQQSK